MNTLLLSENKDPLKLPSIIDPLIVVACISFAITLLLLASTITVLSSANSDPFTSPVTVPTKLPTTEPVCEPTVSPVSVPVSVVAVTDEVCTGPTIFPLIASTKRVESSAYILPLKSNAGLFVAAQLEPLYTSIWSFSGVTD